MGGEEEEGRRGEGGGDARKLGWQTNDKTRHRGVHQPGALSHAFLGRRRENSHSAIRRFEPGRGATIARR